MDHQLERNQLQRSLSALDIRTAHATRKPTVIQAVEGAHFLEGHLNRGISLQPRAEALGATSR